MSNKKLNTSAHYSKPATPEDSQFQTLSPKPVGNSHAFPSPAQGSSPMPSRLRQTTGISPGYRSRTPPPASMALAYPGVSASRPVPGSQYRRLDSAFNSAGALSKNDMDIVQQIQKFNSVAGGVFKPMVANPFSNFTSIPDFLADVERTLEPAIDPLQRLEDVEEKNAVSAASLKPSEEDLNSDPSHSTRRARDKAPETFHTRGLSVADISVLNADYEKNGGGKERNVGSSIVTLNSRGRIRREVKFDGKLETRSIFHGADETEDGNVDDDKSIELEGGIYYPRKEILRDGNETCYGDKTSESGSEEVRLQPDTEMAFPQGSGSLYVGLWPGAHAYGPNGASSLHDVSASSTRKAAMGLAKELRRLSLAPEDLVIPSSPAVDTIDSDLDPDMVGGLPTWEFKRAGLGQFVSSAEVEQQEALLEAYEQGFGAEFLKGSTLEEGSGSENGGHLFVFDRVQPRAAASAIASGSGVGIRRANVSSGEVASVVLQPDEGLEDEENIENEEEEGEGEGEEGGEGGEEEELLTTLEEQEQIERAMAMSIEDLKHQSVGKGKGKAD